MKKNLKKLKKYKDLINPYNFYDISIQYKDILGNSYNLIKQTFPFPAGYDATEESVKELKKIFKTKS